MPLDQEPIFCRPRSVDTDRETIDIRQNANSISPTNIDHINQEKGTNDRLTLPRGHNQQYNGVSTAATQTNEQGQIFHPVEAWTRFREKFSGENNQNITAFLARFDKYCKNNRHPDKLKCEQMEVILDGEAHDAYDSFSDETKNDYQLLRKHLITIFGPAKLPPGESYQKLFNLKMDDNSTVQAHYNKIVKRLRDIQEISEDFKLEVFVLGLPKYIKDYLKLEKPKNISEALELAKSKEAAGASKEDICPQIVGMRIALDDLLKSQGVVQGIDQSL